MRRLFVGNFDFEHRLCEPRRVLPARLARWNAELASAWLSMADDEDLIWTPGRVPAEFWDQLAARGLPRVEPISDWTRCEADVLLVPWGWTEQEFEAGRTHGWLDTVPSVAAVRLVNSRRWSVQRELSWNVGPTFAAVCESLDEIADAIQRMPLANRGWVLKAEFGMSGRERCLGRGLLTVEAANWAKHRLARDGVVFFEPWLERLDEVGIQWHIPRDGSPKLIGIAPMNIAAGGHYRGSWFVKPITESWWESAVEITLRAAEEAQQGGYFGPFGVDAMRYRAANGEFGVRPLQDVNARWTMGRLALGWQRFFADLTSGLWWHGPADDWEFEGSGSLLRTAPEIIDHQPVQHVTAVIVESRPAS